MLVLSNCELLLKTENSTFRGGTVKRSLLLNSSLLTNGSQGVEETSHCSDFKEDQHPTNGRFEKGKCSWSKMSPLQLVWIRVQRPRTGHCMGNSHCGLYSGEHCLNCGKQNWSVWKCMNLILHYPQVPGVVLFLCTSLALLITSCMIVSEEYRPHPRHSTSNQQNKVQWKENTKTDQLISTPGTVGSC